MKDFNFFEGYSKKKIKLNSKNALIYMIISIVIIVFVSYPIFNLYKINKLNNEIAVLKESLGENYSDKESERIDLKKSTIDDLNHKLNSLKNINESIKNTEIINEYLIYTITLAVPEDVFLKSINITEENINIDGVAQNQASIAQLQYNLRSIESFYDIFIPNISNNQGLFEFSITILLQEVVEDETN